MKIPYNIEAEAIVLGRIFNNSTAAGIALDYLDSLDFYEAKHIEIFTAMKTLFNASSEITPLTVCEETSGDIAYLIGLTRFDGFDDLEYFMTILKRCSQQRKIIYALHGVLPLAENDKVPPEEIHVKLTKDLERIFSDSPTDEIHISKVLMEDFRQTGKSMMEFIRTQQQRFAKGENTIIGLSTGYPRLNDLIEGFCPGHYIIIAGRPGHGKTTLALNLMRNMASKNAPIGLFSLEMTKDDISYGLACLDAKISSKQAKRGNISQAQMLSLEESTKKIAKYPIWIEDQSRIRISQLCSKARRMKNNHNIQALFIDYLGEIQAEGKFFSRQEQVQENSKLIRALAKDLQIPVICLCQLNRDSEREGRPPRKSDLRESGQIEADAHVIMMIHNPNAQGNLPCSPMKLFIVKNRFGEEKNLDFLFQGSTGEIFECEYNMKEPQEDFE